MKKHSDKNDNTLVELTLLGDDSAYEELVVRHQRAVMGTAFKVTKSSFLAEDASQDAFVSAWMNLSALHDGSKFGPWVNSIAKNSARTLIFRYRSAIPSISLNVIENEAPEENESEWEPIAEDNTELYEAVEALGEKLRETVRLHYFEDKSVAEIARLLGVPEGTVKWRLSEGRKQLRKGYGIMEKTYDENEPLTVRVMRQVEALKLWRFKNDTTGVDEEYRAVLQNVEALEDSKEKSSMLADTLMMGYWWVPGEKNDDVFDRIKKAAEDGHNDDVMRSVAVHDCRNYSGDEKIDFMKNRQIPYYRENGYPKTLAWVLFWLAYEYYIKREYVEALRCFEEVTKVVPETEAYHANAKASIEGIHRMMAVKADGKDVLCDLSATGEVCKRIGSTLCFAEQPGFSEGSFGNHSCIFWNMASCDSILTDDSMRVGDSRISYGSSEKMTLAYTADDAVCDTPAGHFENCSVFVCEGERSSVTYVETVLCPGVGVVRQRVTRCGETKEFLLSDYRILGGDGLLPFAVGNSWSYSPAEKDDAHIMETENIFTVTGCENGTVTLSNYCLYVVRGYTDTWKGKTLEARERYHEEIDSDNERLRDVSAALARCEELAQTKRQKTHTAVANRVMRRIFSTSPEFNPDCTEKGIWNFFEYDEIRKIDGGVKYDRNPAYSFEWKDIPCSGGILYSFFMTILYDAVGCLWSDEWTDGYRFDRKKIGKYVTKDFSVTGGEKVSTPAGAFEDCRHVSFDYEAWGYFSGRNEYWFAPGVGIVRYEHRDDEDKTSVWNLTGYRGKGEGYFPTDDGLVRHYEPETLEEGWHAYADFTFDKDETGTVMFKDALGTCDRAICEKEESENP